MLIDELGRGTSPAEGVGIAHAIAEQLIDLKVCVALLKFCTIQSLRRLSPSSQRQWLSNLEYHGKAPIVNVLSQTFPRPVRHTESLLFCRQVSFMYAVLTEY